MRWNLPSRRPQLLEISPAKQDEFYVLRISHSILRCEEKPDPGESEPEPIESTEWDIIIGKVIKGNEFNLTELSDEEAQQFCLYQYQCQKHCQHCFPPLKRLVLAGNGITVPLKDWATLTQKLELTEMDLGMCSGVTGDILASQFRALEGAHFRPNKRVRGYLKSSKINRLKCLKFPHENFR